MGDRDFGGGELTTVKLQGKHYVVGPLTMGQERRLRKVMREYQVRQPAPIEIRGLVEAMFLRDPDALLGHKDKIHAKMGVEQTYRRVEECVQVAIREARAYLEIPISPTDPRGLALLMEEPRVIREFLFAILRLHNPGFTAEDAVRMAPPEDDDAEDTSLTSREYQNLLRVVLGDPTAEAAEQAEESGDGAGPKSPGSGGETATSDGRSVEGTPTGSTIPASTSS